MIPVQQTRNEHPLNVGHDCAECFWSIGACRRKRPGDVTRSEGRLDGIAFRVLEVLCDPLHEIVTVAAEIARIQRALFLDGYRDRRQDASGHLCSGREGSSAPLA